MRISVNLIWVDNLTPCFPMSHQKHIPNPLSVRPTQNKFKVSIPENLGASWLLSYIFEIWDNDFTGRSYWWREYHCLSKSPHTFSESESWNVKQLLNHAYALNGLKLSKLMPYCPSYPWYWPEDICSMGIPKELTAKNLFWYRHIPHLD